MMPCLSSLIFWLREHERYLSALCALTLVPVSASRAEPLSRGTAVALALAQNPQLAAARAVEAQSAARRGQADAAQFPAISITLAVGPSLKAKLAPGTGAQSIENTYGDVGLNDLSIALGGQLEVLQPLYTFGKITKRQAAADHELRARRAQTEMTRAQLVVSVAQLYEGLSFARDAERFFDEIEHWLLRTVESTQREIDNDTGTRDQDLMRIETALGAVRIGLHQAQTSRRQAEAGLRAYLALSEDASIEPKEPELVLLPQPVPSRGQLIALAQRQRPELRALAEGSAAYTALAEAEAAGKLPDFFALLFASGGYTPGRDLADSRYIRDPLNGFYPGLLVGARWQLTGDMADKRADENHAKATELQQMERWAKLALPAEVTKAFEDSQRAKADHEAAEKAVSTAKRWSVQASADYSVGLGDVRDLTDATQAFVQLRAAAYDAKYRHNMAMAELERAIGGFDPAQANPLYPCKQE
jgi:outer membrane protein TolC